MSHFFSEFSLSLSLFFSFSSSVFLTHLAAYTWSCGSLCQNSLSSRITTRKNGMYVLDYYSHFYRILPFTHFLHDIGMWGFSVEAELIENADRQDELCCYVSRVEDKSVAMQNGNYSIKLFFFTAFRLTRPSSTYWRVRVCVSLFTLLMKKVNVLDRRLFFEFFLFGLLWTLHIAILS